MIIIILCYLIVMALFIYNWIKDLGWDWVMFFFSFFIGILGAFGGLLIALILPMNYETEKWSVQIESLQDNSSVHGSFFLGCGQINGSMKYVFYCKEDNDTYKMYQVEYYDASIKYTDGMAKENIIYTHPDKSIWNLFALDLDCYDYSYVFEVPMGTIKNNYNLDAQ